MPSSAARRVSTSRSPLTKSPLRMRRGSASTVCSRAWAMSEARAGPLDQAPLPFSSRRSAARLIISNPRCAAKSEVDSGRVVGRDHLDDVEADEVDAAQARTTPAPGPTRPPASACRCPGRTPDPRRRCRS